MEVLTNRFEEFWSAYPKKCGKKPCRQKWELHKLDLIADRIIKDVELRKRVHRTWIEGFVPNPLTYINQERWEDEVEHVRENRKVRQSGAAVIAEGCAGAFEPD